MPDDNDARYAEAWASMPRMVSYEEGEVSTAGAMGISWSSVHEKYRAAFRAWLDGRDEKAMAVAYEVACDRRTAAEKSADIAAARREGMEAMRERAAKCAQFEAGYHGIRSCANAIRALPIEDAPGEAGKS